jgi:hypothetical protein
MMIGYGCLILGAIALVSAIVCVATRRPVGPRTVADPAALREVGTHRNEIAAPDPLAPTRPSKTRGGRISGPNGTTSWERWETDETPEPTEPAPPAPPQA